MTDTPQHYTKHVGETRNVAVNCTDELDSGELVASVTSVSATGLTITNDQVSTAELTILGESVAIGKAIQFTVAGGTAGTTYDIVATYVTDSSPAQTLVAHLPLTVTT